LSRYPIRVLIADDQAPFRRVVHAVIDAEEDIEVVAEASDGEEAVALASEHFPNVVLMDVRMPKLSGIDAARVLSEVHPATRILMFTVSDDASDLSDAIKAGASGYLLKDVHPGRIAGVIRRVHSGQAVLSPAVASVLLPEIAAAVAYDGHGIVLTNHELRVLQRLATGVSSAQAGTALHMSEAAVNCHLHNLLLKLHLRGRIEGVDDARADGRASRSRPVAS
jgi:DNA-binding NarL/FixJ family response regulator